MKMKPIYKYDGGDIFGRTRQTYYSPGRAAEGAPHVARSNSNTENPSLIRKKVGVVLAGLPERAGNIA